MTAREAHSSAMDAAANEASKVLALDASGRRQAKADALRERRDDAVVSQHCFPVLMDTELYIGPETWEMAEAASVMLDGSLATAEREHEVASREMAAALTLCTPAEARAALLGLHGGGNGE